MPYSRSAENLGEEGDLGGLCSVKYCFLHKCDIFLMMQWLMPHL